MYVYGVNKSSLQAVKRQDAVMGWYRTWDRHASNKLLAVLFHRLCGCRCSHSYWQLHNINSFHRDHNLFWFGCHSRNLKNETILFKASIPEGAEIKSEAVKKWCFETVSIEDDA